MKLFLNRFSALALLASLPLFSIQANFTDISASYEYGDAVIYVKAQGIVSGYPDGTYRPESTINRAEFTKIIVEAIAADNYGNESNCFSDVGSEWFAPYVCYAKSQGIIGGYPDGTFRPGNQINFVESAKIIGESLDVKASTSQNSDVWYGVYVDGLSAQKAIPVSISGFTHNVTRGEMAEMVYRLKASVNNKSSQSFASLNGEASVTTNTTTSAENVDEALDSIFSEFEDDFNDEENFDLNIDLEDESGSDQSSQVAGSEALPIRKYKDGTYTEDGVYESPGGTNTIAVTLIVESDMVEFAMTTEVYADSVSQGYITFFNGGLNEIVVGKSLVDLEIPQTINGSSLTSTGFNDALAKIKRAAQN